VFSFAPAGAGSGFCPFPHGLRRGLLSGAPAGACGPRSAILAYRYAQICSIGALSSNTRMTVLPVTKQQAIYTRGAPPPCQGLSGSSLTSVSRPTGDGQVDFPKRRTAHSAGRFSSILKIKRSVPVEARRCLHAPIQPRRRAPLRYRLR
jgi:hypothetical protein